MFSQPVISVGATSIFARITSSQTQFLVYQMSYKSDHANAMILPLPVGLPASESSVQFMDLSRYENFFSDLEKGFPYVPHSTIGCSAEPKSLMAELKVFKIGNYVASFVPSLPDFSRLDEKFRLPDSVWLQLPSYKDFGFVVFQLAEGSLRPHPMAFEFASRNRSIFFPTLHVHDGEVHSNENFDHFLYMQHAGLDSRVRGYMSGDMPDPVTKLIRSKQTASLFSRIEATHGIVLGNLLVHRKIVRGNQPNNDIEFEPHGDPIIPTFNFRPWAAWLPWLLVLGGLSYFFARRERMRRAESQQLLSK
jgi:hypothetical protein